VSQLTIPNTAGISPDSVYNHIETTCSHPNLAGRTCDFPYQLVSPTSFSSSSPISLCLIHNSSIIAENKVKKFLSISPSHDHELILSKAYTKYSIHRERHSLSTASTQEYSSSHHSHDYESTPECRFSTGRAFLHN
jgi:hypothetical protein